MKSNEMS